MFRYSVDGGEAEAVEYTLSWVGKRRAARGARHAPATVRDDRIIADTVMVRRALAGLAAGRNGGSSPCLSRRYASTVTWIR